MILVEVILLVIYHVYLEQLVQQFPDIPAGGAKADAEVKAFTGDDGITHLPDGRVLELVVHRLEDKRGRRYLYDKYGNRV